MDNFIHKNKKIINEQKALKMSICLDLYIKKTNKYINKYIFWFIFNVFGSFVILLFLGIKLFTK